MATIEEQVAADIAALEDGAATVSAAVDQYKAHKADMRGAAISTPLVALVNAALKPEQVAAFADRFAGTGPALESILREVTALVAETNVTLATLDVAGFAVAADRLTALAKSPYQLVEDDVMVAAAAAVTKWSAAYTGYQQASGANVARQTAGPRRGKPRGSRGPGKWLEDHGWYFQATCENCGKVITSASNPGSFSDAMANHWPTCRDVRDNDGNRVDRLYIQDPELQAINEAMYAVADGKVTEASASGMTIRRVDANASAA